MNKAGVELSRDDYRCFLAENQKPIDRIIAVLARKYALTSDAQQEFRAVVLLSLVEDDYRILRAFRNESSIWTYLTKVIHNVYVSDRCSRTGRWRPSAAASRIGPLGIELERLIQVEGFLLSDALETLRTKNGEIPQDSLRELGLKASLRRRRKAMSGLRPAQAVADSDPERDLLARERTCRSRDARTILKRSFVGLSDGDRRLLGMRFHRGLTVAEVARRLRLDQKKLYRRMSGALRRLRREIETAGFNRLDMLSMIDERRVDLSLDWD